MVRLTRRSIYRLLTIMFLCTTTIWVGCSNNSKNVYNPPLGIYEDFSLEENNIFNQLVEIKATIDTTTNTNVFKKANNDYKIALKHYKYIIDQAELKLQNSEDNSKLESLYNVMLSNRKQCDYNAFKYAQVEKEGIEVLINFNILRNELGVCSNKKLDIYNSFSVLDNNIERYNIIKDAFTKLNSIPNKDNIIYYSEDSNQYQIVFICANLEDLITIRSFIEKTDDLYTNRKDKKYVNNNKSDVRALAKEYKSIGNRKELCNLYMPNSYNKVNKLEQFALYISRN